MSVCIVGAGVIGLTIAHQLLETQDDVKAITIISEQFPQDKPINHTFTSPWAGAHFRPFPHRDSDYGQDRRESQYTRATFNYFKGQSKEWLNEATVQFMRGIDWLEKPSKEYVRLGDGYNCKSLNDFRKESELPDGVSFGCGYETWCLNAPEYLTFLYDQVVKISKRRNVELRFKRIRLTGLQDVADLYGDLDVVINASGLGLQWNGGFDPKCYMVRGQTLLLDVGNAHNKIKYSNCTITHQDKDGNWTFVIKRPGKFGGKAHYILGGTKQPNDFRVMPREEDTKQLITRGSKLFPDLLKHYEIKNVNVGFRPLRHDGSRVELEYQKLQGKNSFPIIHAYGLGGMGFETSVGVSHHVLQLYRISRSNSKL